MYSKEQKYRIIVGHNPSSPYQIEQKAKGWFTFWRSVGQCRAYEDAEDILRSHIAKRIPAPGTIMKELGDREVIVEKLQGLI